MLNIGDKLANGATVLAVRPTTVCGSPAVVVLALSHAEFVTWVADKDGNGTTWGHYFGDDLLSGLTDLDTRVSKAWI